MAPQRILIVKPSSLGDIAHALPAAAAVKGTWPEATVAWLANVQYRALVAASPDVDEVYTVDRDAWRGRWGVFRGTPPLLRLVAALRERRFDLAVDLQGLFRSALYGWLSGARERVGEADCREIAGALYTRRAKTSRTGQHAEDRYLEIVRAIGADVSKARSRLEAEPEALAWFEGEIERAFGPAAEGPIVLFAMDTRWETKLWPAAHYAELARLLADGLGARVVAIGAGARPPATDTIERLGGGKVHVVPRATSLAELVAMASASDVVVGSDSGPAHVASAAGTATVTLYGPTAPELTAPRGDRAARLAGECERAPCYRRECRDVRCMASIEPAEVAEVVGTLATGGSL